MELNFVILLIISCICNSVSELLLIYLYKYVKIHGGKNPYYEFHLDMSYKDSVRARVINLMNYRQMTIHIILIVLVPVIPLIYNLTQLWNILTAALDWWIKEGDKRPYK